MRRGLLIAFALVASLLLVTAQPAAAADAELEVASKNTTDTELSNASTLTNLTVQGSGESARAVLESQPGTVFDGFDDGNINGWTGSTSDYAVTSATSWAGSHSIDHTGQDGSGDINLDITDDTYSQVTFAYRPDDYSAQSRVDYEASGGSSDTVVLLIGDGTNSGAGNVTFVNSADNFVDTKIHLSQNTWYGIKITNIDYANNQYDIEVVKKDGTVVGTYPNAEFRNAASQIGYIDVGAQETDAHLDHFDTDLSNSDGAKASGHYVGQAHTADGVQKVWANVTLQNAKATITAQGNDGSGWTDLNSTTTTTTANHTLAVPSTYDDYRLNVNFTRLSGTTTAQLHDEGLLFNAGTPSGSNADPTGNVTSFDGDISLDVSDSDFGLAQGDSVTVTATNASGGQIGSTTVTSNGTVTFSYSAKAGENDVTWTLTDAYGETATVSQSFTTPNVLSIYNESAPNQLVTGVSNTVTVSFYGANDTVFQKSTTDGTVNLSGLPAAPPNGYEIIVSDGADYQSRRIIVDSLFEQQSVYLLPTSATAYDVTFQLQDFTGGNWEPETTRLYIEGPITKDYDGDGNTSTQYQTILASTFDVGGGFPATLLGGKRYRLRIVNSEGDARVVGSYTATADDVVPITIKGLKFNPPEGSGWETDLTTTGSNLTWKYKDPTGKTSRLNVTVRAANGTVVYQDSVRNGVGNYSIYDLPLNNSTSYTLAWNATRDGQRIGQTKPVAADGTDVRVPFDPDWLGTVGMLMIVFTLSLADARKTSYVAMSAVGMAGVLMAIQAVTIFEPLWFGAALIAVGSHIRTMQTR